MTYKYPHYNQVSSQSYTFDPKSEAFVDSRLIIKKFGPIDEVILDLKHVNVFIGPQATGKSAIAKIYTIFKAPAKFINQGIENLDSLTDIDFRKILSEYNIQSFLRPETEIRFDSGLHTMTYANGKIGYVPKLLFKIYELVELSKSFNANKEMIITLLNEISRNFIHFNIRSRTILDQEESRELSYNNLTKSQLSKLISIIESHEATLSTDTAIYIPAERTIINIIRKNIFNLQLHEVPLPKNILSFAAELEKIENEKLDLNFIVEGLKYDYIDGEDRIFTEDGYSINLSEAASGIQSVLPILKFITTKPRRRGHKSFVIEEPELNLFPNAQYKLIQFLESGRPESHWEDHGTIHTYTTHSPYILSALNNLLYAHKVTAKLDRKHFQMTPIKDRLRSVSYRNKSLEIVRKIIAADINPRYFTAYQIYRGKAESIFDKRKGLIMDNYIDECSDKMADDFEKLMELDK